MDIEQLFETNFHKIFNYILFRVGDVTTAEDLTSDTFLRAMSYSGKYDPDKSSTSTWLRTIAKNVVNDFICKKGKVVFTELEASLPSITDITSDAENAELKRRLAELVLALPEKQKELIIMRYTLGMTKREIAKEMDMTISNVGVTLHRTIKNLREKLADYL